MKHSLFVFAYFTSLFAESDSSLDLLDASFDPPISTIEEPAGEVAALFSPKPVKPPEPASIPENGYTINYKTVSIIEYVKFTSKICNVNFIFDEADLNFTVTVVSEDPITTSNVMATLVQILRIHGLQLIEQGNNLLIHKSDEVKQVATLYMKDATGAIPPITTRIFRLQRSKADSVAAIIRSMISKTAILEVSGDTHQIILTDVTANVDKVAMLIENLDAPENLIEIKSYEAIHNQPDHLIEIATQLMAPIVRGSPFILVPNSLANTIFVVSTPELTSKTLEVLRNLDLEAKKSVVSERKLRSENIFVYKLEQRSGEDVIKGLGTIADNLEKSGVPHGDLIETIDSAKWIRETNSIMLVGSKDSIEKVKEFIGGLDTPSTDAPQKSSFFVYSPAHRSANEIFSAIEEMANNLKGSTGSDAALIATIHSAKINAATNTITFSGEERTFSRVRELLATIDNSGKETKKILKKNFFVYQIKSNPHGQIEASLKSFAKSIDKSNVDDEGLPAAIDGMKYIKETNAILFTGSDATLKRLQEVLPSFDPDTGKTPANNQFYIYKCTHQKGTQLAASLKDVGETLRSSNLADPAMLNALDSMKWVKSTNSLIFTGDPNSLKKIEDLIATLDIPTTQKKSGYYIYKLQNISGETVEKNLDRLAKDFKASGMTDTSVIEVIENAKYIKETDSILLTGDPTAIDEVKSMIARYDVPATVKKSGYFLYKLQSVSTEILQKNLAQLAKDLKSSGMGNTDVVEVIENAKYVKDTNSVLLTGDPTAIDEVKSMIARYDVQTAAKKSGYFLYKLQSVSTDILQKNLAQLAKDLKSSGMGNTDVVEVIENAKYVKDTNSVLLTGDPTAIDEVKSMIARYDVQTAAKKSGYFVVKLQNISGEVVQKNLGQLTKDLKASGMGNTSAVEVMDNAKYVKDTNSILLTGDPAAIDEVKSMIARYDVATIPKKSGYFLYKLQSISVETLQKNLDQLGKDLKSSGMGHTGVVEVIENAKYVKETHSVLLTGDPAAIDEVKSMIARYDVATIAKKSGYFLYKLQNSSVEAIQKNLEQLAKDLRSSGMGNTTEVEVMERAKYVKETNSILLTGDPTGIDEVKAIIARYDIPTITKKSGYFVYKLENASEDIVQKNLDRLAKDLKSSGAGETTVIQVIENAKYIKETHSILLTGDPVAIDEVKSMIARYDLPVDSSRSNYFMYKPQSLTGPNLEKSIRDVAKSLKAADLADPQLLSSIANMKYTEATNSLVFTGTTDSIAKIQTLVKEIDVPPAKHEPIHTLGNSTYLLYKLKYAASPQLTASINAIAADLKKSGNADKDFLTALNSMKYIRDTNSLMFTGSPEALAKVESLVEKFDVTGASAEPKEVSQERSAPNFYVYKPQSLAGPELEKMLQDFAENLRQSGLSDPDLFNTISSMRWIDKTQSLLFTGNPKSLDQVKELLRDFDNGSNLPSNPSLTGPSEPQMIQSIDNTSFLVYKLQFHKGDEIQGALRQIAKDLILSNAPVNQNLLNSINSIQWLEVTNSLLCSGDQETLTRLRELIKNLDIPLKQVFIEMLVIQTSMTNALTFGLEWGAKYKYRDKFSGTLNNLSPANTNSPLNAALLPLTPTNTPTPQVVPILGPGFDLGIIGEVIRHGGDTYLTLGSLLAALQTDAETTIVMTPKIITQDGRTSTIFQGNNIPFAGSFVSNSSVNATGGTIGTTNIEYRDIGLSLTVTPVLGNSDIVTLDINLDQSSTGQVNAAQQQITFTTSGVPTAINGITTSKTTMQTTVHVPDNHFLVLSGMVQNSNIKQKSGIPCLGGLPFIGAAFSQDNTTISNTNVVIFLRPHIINSIDDITRITHEQEVYFRDQAMTPNLEHQFKEAMELIKTVDDE